YGQLVSLLGKYSKFAPAGEKAALRQAAIAADNPETTAEDASAAGAEDAPF
ncbi:MAG: inositol monophosphatase, partial [Betaproteobacteria bacterium]|nr:inositol monophosphatase [Betaproteobacteria bacterium]